MSANIEVGKYNTLTVIRDAIFGMYLDDGNEGILLPKRFIPAGLSIGDDIKVFIYHDGEDRLIATTQHPFGQVGDIVQLTAVNVTPSGAFLDNGLMKDLFVPTKHQLTGMKENGKYLVYIYNEAGSDRMAATEKFDYLLSNEELTVTELEEVKLTIYRKTDLGYAVIINNKHTGLLHSNEVYRPLAIGDKVDGYIKKLYPEGNKIDVVLGKHGYQRVEGEVEKVLRLLQENEGFLPYHDKSAPEDIYNFFGMSKKTFKMATGNLFRQRLITFNKAGIILAD